jgi:hypothetical protein
LLGSGGVGGELSVPPPPLVGQPGENLLIGGEPSHLSLPLVGGSEPSAPPPPAPPSVVADDVVMTRSGGPIFQLGTPESGGSLLGRHTDSSTSCYNDAAHADPVGDTSDEVLRQEDGWPLASQRIHELEQQLDREKEQRQQLATSNQQLAAENKQLATANQQLAAAEHEQLRQLTTANQQLAAENKQLATANQQLAAENEQLQQRFMELQGQQDSSSQLIAYEQELKAKKNTIELLVTEKTELESKVPVPM